LRLGVRCEKRALGRKIDDMDHANELLRFGVAEQLAEAVREGQ